MKRNLVVGTLCLVMLALLGFGFQVEAPDALFAGEVPAMELRDGAVLLETVTTLECTWGSGEILDLVAIAENDVGNFGIIYRNPLPSRHTGKTRKSTNTFLVSNDRGQSVQRDSPGFWRLI